MQKYIKLGKQIYNMENTREQRRMVVFVLRSMWHDGDMKKLIAFLMLMRYCANFRKDINFI